MLPILLVGVGLLAVGAIGCAETPQPRPASTPPPPPPEPQLDFSEVDNAFAYRVYQKLLQNGSDPYSVDRGYYQVNYGKRFCQDASALFCTLGSGDAKLAAAEVIDHCLERDPSCASWLEAELPMPLPWKLDDGDDATTFDLKIREKITQHIQILRAEIKKLGFSEDSDEYRERLAVGMYALIAVPKAEEIAKKTSAFQKAVHELETLGLKNYLDYLQKDGGLRVEGDQSEELSALLALQSGKGECTEHAKILYAAMRMAGLKPFFVFVNPWKTEHPQLKDFLRQNPMYYHVCIGLKIRGKVRLLDSAILESNPAHRDFYPLSLRDYLSADYANHGAIKKNRRDLTAARRDFEISLKLSPNFPVALLNMGATYALENKLDQAFEYFKQAAEYAPDPGMPYFALGLLYKQGGRPQLAKKSLLHAVQGNPDFAPAFFEMGMTHIENENWEEAVSAFRRTTEIDPQNPDFHAAFGIAQGMHGKDQAGAHSLSQAILLREKSGNVAPFEWYFHRGRFSGASGNFLQARSDFRSVLQRSPKLPPNILEPILQTLTAEFEASYKPTDAASLRKNLESEIQIDLPKAQARIAAATLLWEAGKTEAAIAEQAQIAAAARKQEARLRMWGKILSPAAKKFLKDLFSVLPDEMRRDKKVQGQWQRLF